MDLYKKTYRVSEETKKTVEEIAAQEGCTETAVFENAIRYYKDYLYMQTDGAFINESVKRTFLASVNLMETRLNNRTNKVLSELAIQQAIICQVGRYFGRMSLFLLQKRRIIPSNYREKQVVPNRHNLFFSVRK